MKDHQRPLTVGNLMAILSTIDPRTVICGQNLSDLWSLTMSKDGQTLFMMEKLPKHVGF